MDCLSGSKYDEDIAKLLQEGGIEKQYLNNIKWIYSIEAKHQQSFIPFSSVKYHSSKGRSIATAYGAPNCLKQNECYAEELSPNIWTDGRNSQQHDFKE